MTTVGRVRALPEVPLLVPESCHSRVGDQGAAEWFAIVDGDELVAFDLGHILTEFGLRLAEVVEGDRRGEEALGGAHAASWPGRGRVKVRSLIIKMTR